MKFGGQIIYFPFAVYFTSPTSLKQNRQKQNLYESFST